MWTYIINSSKKEGLVNQKNSMEQNIGILLLFIGVAYLFSIGVRMYWPIHFGDNISMYDAGQLMINTNDGYYFSSAARDILDGITREDHQRASAYGVSPGLVLLTAYATKLTPFSLETVTLYLPTIISSLIVIPVILTGRLLGHTFLGFLAALLASITWSYYNRTMTGYYDTDMFSVLLQFTIFYSLLSVVYKKNLFSILLSVFFIMIYPYFYSQGVSIVYVVFIFTVGYLLSEYFGIVRTTETETFKEKENIFFSAIILLSIALMTTISIEYRIGLLLVTLMFLLNNKLERKYLLYIAIATFFGFLFFGNIFQLIIGKVTAYAVRGVETEGLHFYQVVQTVREAGSIPMTTVANRVSGSSLGLFLSVIGYIVLVMRHKPFIIALPLIGVGLFSYVGGLRFTVYAVPIAAISVVYFFYILGSFFKNERLKYLFIVFATILMLDSNITHIIGYKVPTVLNKSEVNDLQKLKQISTSDDYTITWWDYGYPIWFYSDTNTLIDGGKHTNDNFIVSKILQTTSSELAANLSRLTIETYVDSNYTIVANTLFKNGQKNQINPSELLSELESDVYKLPKKTRDVYIYLPYRMLNIFPTVMLFGNLDLMTGEAERKVAFYPTNAISSSNGVISFQNGIVFDSKKGNISIGKNKKDVKYFIATQNIQNGKVQLQSQLYHADGEYAVVYMKSYNRFVIMDIETFNSMYVQMFILEKYDHDLFELVVSSPYSKIYKLKK